MAREKQDYGHTVVAGFVRRTSVSALSAFDPATYGGCPRRWWFTRVAGVKEEETAAQRAGTDGHAEAEHYLTTGEDVLSPMMRAGKHLLPAPGADLVIEAPFGELGGAIKLRDEIGKLQTAGDAVRAGAIRQEMQRVAGLCAGSIPLDGYIDLRHQRGEYVDAAGLVHSERSEHGFVVEVCDHKTTSSIEKFAKSPDEMASSIQMVGYANYVLNTIPHVDHVRLSHIYYQSRGARLAKKVTSLVHASRAREEWKRVDALALYMEEVARAPRVEDVEANTRSCEAYRGCPHVSRCPITRKLGTGGNNMSLFNTPSTETAPANGAAQQPAQSQGSLFGNLLKSEPSPVAPPKEGSNTAMVNSLFGPPADPARQAAVEAEKLRLAAEDAGQLAPVAGVKLAVTACVLEKEYLVDCADGSKPRRMKFAGSSKGFYFFVDAQGGRAKLEIADDVWEIAPGGAGSAVSPPDAPKPDFVSSAAPLSAEKIAAIEDPELKKRAQEHADAHAQRAAQAGATAPAGEKTSGRCPEGGRRIALSNDALATQTLSCRCGKEWKLKTLEPKKEGETWTCEVPAHNLPKPKKVEAPAAPVAASTGAAPQVSAPVAAAPQAAVSGIMLFVDIAVERGAALTPLDNYYGPIVRDLEERHGAADIRCAPQDSPLAFGKWKGALAAMVRSQPPAPGIYSAQSSSEVAQVVVEALAPQCSAVMRGMR